MPIGVCKLCLKERELQKSHFIPQEIFKRVQGIKGKDRNPVVMTRAISLRTSEQLQDYLLCAECEGRFNRGGEQWMLRMMGSGNRFPLRDRLVLALPGRQLPDSSKYSGVKLGIDTQRIAYFALSVVWRAAAHVWRGTLGGGCSRLILGETEEHIRQYLLGERLFPEDVAVTIHVCTDRVSRGVLLPPADAGSTFGPGIEMTLLGVYFFVFFGNSIETKVREMCCVTGLGRPIYLRSCLNRVMQHYRDLTKVSRKSKGLLEEWPD